MLLHQIEALVEVGVAHVVLAVSYHAEQLEQEMQVRCSFDIPKISGRTEKVWSVSSFKQCELDPAFW